MVHFLWNKHQVSFSNPKSGTIESSKPNSWCRPLQWPAGTTSRVSVESSSEQRWSSGPHKFIFNFTGISRSDWDRNKGNPSRVYTPNNKEEFIVSIIWRNRRWLKFFCFVWLSILASVSFCPRRPRRIRFGSEKLLRIPRDTPKCKTNFHFDWFSGS